MLGVGALDKKASVEGVKGSCSVLGVIAGNVEGVNNLSGFGIGSVLKTRENELLLLLLVLEVATK